MNNKSYPFWKVSPHIFILGAGASRAAFPRGDKYGNQLPLMNDFIDILNLYPLLKKYNIDYADNNIEEIYNNIYLNNPDSPFLPILDKEIYKYFSGLQIPDYVTLYDRLILSLQKKDAIFSFNWDPLLLQAYSRNFSVSHLPKIFFLHGNVAAGVCVKDKRVGLLGNLCSNCKKPLIPTKLLYPISKKDYNSDPFIAGEWESLKLYLDNSFITTIFGYSAPETDVAAREMMQKAWEKNPRFELNEIEIIDIQSKTILEKNWSDFTHSHHFAVFKNIKHSLSFLYARRSCEHWGDAIMQNFPWYERNIPKYKNLDKLQNWVQPLVKEEINFIDNDIPILPYRVKK